MTQITQVELARSAASAEHRDASASLALLSEFQINSDADQEFAIEVLRDVKVKHAALEERRKKITIPLNAALREVNDLFRPAREALDECDAILRKKITEYRAAVEERNRAALAAAAAAATVEEAAEAIAVAQPAAQLSGASLRRVIKFEIQNSELVPREYWSVDSAKVAAAVRAGADQIPGVRIFEEEILAVRK